jgi:hypothetical protein
MATRSAYLQTMVTRYFLSILEYLNHWVDKMSYLYVCTYVHLIRVMPNT